MEFRSPRAHNLWDKWRYVWMLAWERQRRLHDHLMYLQDVERVRQFSWDDWRKRVSSHDDKTGRPRHALINTKSHLLCFFSSSSS